jgi:SOS-response transcriptional repressor LexA
LDEGKKDIRNTDNKEEAMSTRPTKKQYETLEFIKKFIAEHGYSPSYREIMIGCDYTSVATVALHVGNLIKRGHLVKRDKSARSLEVVNGEVEKKTNSPVEEHHLKHLFSEIEARFKEIEAGNRERLDELYVLVGAVNVLGHTDVGRAYAARLPREA